MSKNLIQLSTNTEELLSTLLGIARLESGRLSTNIQHSKLWDLLSPLIKEFAIVAKRKELKLRYIPRSCLSNQIKSYLDEYSRI